MKKSFSLGCFCRTKFPSRMYPKYWLSYIIYNKLNLYCILILYLYLQNTIISMFLKSQNLYFLAKQLVSLISAFGKNGMLFVYLCIYSPTPQPVSNLYTSFMRCIWMNKQVFFFSASAFPFQTKNRCDDAYS